MRVRAYSCSAVVCVRAPPEKMALPLPLVVVVLL